MRCRELLVPSRVHGLGKRRASWAVLGLMLAIWLLGQAPQLAHADWTVGTPIVTYWEGAASVDLTDAVAQHAVDGGFNLVWVRSLAQLNLAHQYGLRGLWVGSTDDPTVAQIRTHPAHYGYYITDEPSAAAFPELGAIVARLRNVDPDHVAYINLFPSYASNEQLGTNGYQEHLSQYMSVVQPSLLAYDHYSFFNGADGPDYFKNLAIISHTARQANIPFMNTVQASAWFSSWRVPNEHELRFLNYTTLAYGGQGISYWAYNPQNPNTGGLAPDSSGVPTSVYTALSSIHPRFVAIAEQVQPFNLVGAYHLGDLPWGFGTSDGSSPLRPLPDDSPFTITPSVPNTNYVTNAPVKGMLVSLFGSGDQPADTQLALVVNLDYTQSLTKTVTGPRDLLLFNAGSGTWVATGSPQALLNLSPGGGRLLRLVPEGDVNSDGYVDYGDLSLLAPFYGLGPGMTWLNGDFDADGFVNWDDIDLMAANFGMSPTTGPIGVTAAQLAGALSTIPEPSTLVLMSVFAALLAGRSRSRRFADQCDTRRPCRTASGSMGE